MSTIECIECGSVVETTGDVMIGEVIECMTCAAELEVISVTPITVELAPEIEEDWGE
jgi:alpha-aminoadipate carrier protein LysW